MLGFFKKQQAPVVKVSEEELGVECTVLDFDSTLTKFSNLKPKAQVTFLYRLVGILPFDIVKVLNTYVSNRLGHAKNNDKRQGQHHLSREPKLRRDQL